MIKLFGFLNSIESRNQLCLYGNGRSFTFSELNLISANYAEILKRRGVRKGNRIAIYGDNSIEYVLLIAALWRTGAIPVPINIKLLPKDITEIIRFAKCSHLLIQDKFKLKLTDKLTKLIEFPSIDWDIKKENVKELEIDENSTGVIIFTSGSTGQPKGVMLPFNSLINSAKNANHLLKQSSGDSWLASLPFYHIGGFSTITRSFLYGTSLIIPDSLKTEDIAKAIKNYSPTIITLVSTQLKRLIENKVKPGGYIKYVLLGGGQIEPKLIYEAARKGWKVSNVYGSSETSAFVTANSFETILAKPESVGLPLSRNKVKIIDENGNEANANSSGEILIKSSALMSGYLFDENETKKKLKDGYFYTADIGYLDDDGFLFVLARRTDLIISGGENIIPFEIENAIKQIPAVSEVCVVGIEDKNWGQILTAAVVTKNNLDLTYKELKEYLLDLLPSFKIPKNIFIVDELPKTSLGKIKRDEVISLLLNMRTHKS